jgi:glucokinase
LGATLIADIGGTSTRFAVVKAGRPHGIVHFDKNDFADPQALIGRALTVIADNVGEPIDEAVLAIAGPVDEHGVQMTNRSWTFNRTELVRAFKFQHLTLLNDFEALAYALPTLRADELITLAPGVAAAGPQLAIGPGTGLGAALYLTDVRRVLPTEAGHISFGPAQSDEDGVFAKLRARLGPLSAEAVLAGPGLPLLHAAMTGGEPETPEALGRRILAREPGTAATMALYTRLLGRFAGDLALAFRAGGGVFLAGGVAQRLKDCIDPIIFRTAFAAHPPYEEWLGGVPIHLITADEPGLIGCAAIAGLRRQRDVRS